MALINCPECGREISNQAASCPVCGRPIKSAALTTEGNTFIDLQPLPSELRVSKTKMLPNYEGKYLKGFVPELAQFLGKKIYFYAYADFLTFGEPKKVKGTDEYAILFALSYEQIIDIEVENLGKGRNTILGRTPMGMWRRLGEDKNDCKLHIIYWDIAEQREQVLEFQDARTFEGIRTVYNGDILREVVLKQKGIRAGFARHMSDAQCQKLNEKIVMEIEHLPVKSLEKACKFFTMSDWTTDAKKDGAHMPLFSYNADFTFCVNGLLIKKNLILYDQIDHIAANGKKVYVTYTNDKMRLVDEVLTIPKCNIESVQEVAKCFKKIIEIIVSR